MKDFTLIFIVGCLVECLRRYYKEFIGLLDENSSLNAINYAIQGKSII